ncbi:hypothetical protein HPB50_001415 [Hyalomma asiaticum]|uniref:Uncharacterized protein n=1 Tax=Hyalomma asiaticum TaxID=266040 RepID=A0ACB7RUP3_HYAAI|nr:hypothetical protein HPB50_001415 [Hyalomma asiaticum]
MKPGYACVHCGEMQQQLYKSYGPDLLKLSRCSRCNHVVDEYIEMEFSIVLIDAVLQKLEAYRHIIFNVGMGRPWKIALLFLLGEALEHWMSRQQTHKAGYDLEWHFYIICLFLVASSYGKLLALPANLWGCDRIQSQLFLATFFLFSQVQACRAVTGMGRLQTAAIVFASYSVQHSLNVWMSPFL